MRDYLIEGLPYRAIVKIELVPAARMPRIVEMSLKVLKDSGYDRNAPGREKHHVFSDLSKPPRATVLLVASQAIKELQVVGLPPVRELHQINQWLFTLPDEALLQLLKICVDQHN